MKHKRMYQLTALLLALTVGISITGCGGKEDKPAGTTGKTERGRYVESPVELPEGVDADDIAQIGIRDGKLYFLESRMDNEVYTFAEYIQDGQSGFTKTECEWLNKLELKEAFWRMNYIRGEGAQAVLYAQYSEEEGSYWGHLFATKDGKEVQEITPQGWKEGQEMDGFMYYDSPEFVSFADSDTPVGGFYDRLEFYGSDTGELVNQISVSNNYLEAAVAGKDGFYLFPCSDMSALTGVEKYQVGKNEPVEVIEFNEKSSGLAQTFVDVTSDGNVVICNDEGFYRYEAGEKSWKQIIPARYSSLIMETMWCQGIAAMDDGVIFALFKGEGGGLMRYDYDPDLEVGTGRTLTVYTVYESSVIKQAAALFQKKHPDVEVIVETELTYDDIYGGNVDLNSIYSSLNAEILAGNASDILILDGLNAKSFMEKGLLLDLEEILAPMEEKGELLTNITQSYRNEDGTRYAVPLRFALNLLVGKDVNAKDVQDMKSMAADFAARQESMLGERTVWDLVDEFAPFFTDSIIQDKQLNREVLKEYLEYLKVIAENCGIVESYGDRERHPDIWDIASSVQTAFYQADGFNQSMLPVSAAKLVNGTVACFENAYIPKFEAGIYSQTKEPELAKEFLAFALSNEVQNADFYDGFPINAVSLENQAGKDRTDAEAYTTIDLGGGQSIGFEIKDFDGVQADELLEMCRSVDKKVVEDTEVKNKLADSVAGYLDGSRTLEETIDRVEAGLRMYLAE